jgi:hypothetical protein
MDDAGETWEGINLAPTLRVVEARKDVAGEQCFGRPDRMSSAHSAKTDARSKLRSSDHAEEEAQLYSLVSRRRGCNTHSKEGGGRKAKAKKLLIVYPLTNCRKNHPESKKQKGKVENPRS